MTESRVFCDSCRCLVLEQRTHLLVESGPLRERGVSSIDLCPVYVDRLADLLRAKELVTQEAPV